MQSPSYKAIVDEAVSLKSYLNTSNLIRGVLSGIRSSLEPSILEEQLKEIKDTSPELVRWRVMEHSLLVGRLYAIYENFCESLLEEWVEFLVGEVNFDNLPKKILEHYPIGFSNIISMIPSPRYPNFNVKDMVSNYHSALQGNNPYFLNAACLTFHKNNLRWTELLELFVRCGVSDLSSWVAENNGLISHFTDNSERLVEQVSSKLSNFIQYRNDSSHGIVETDEILGNDDLVDLIDFILCFATCLDELISWKKLEVLEKKNRAIFVGEVKERFSRANAVIVTVKNVRIEFGQNVFVKKDGGFWSTSITSIKLNNVSVSFAHENEGAEVGIQTERLPEKNSKIYILPYSNS